ncbi:MAG: hypothetical protein JEZ01_12730 [Labilibaculum sp.]|nr:hypothetical protein [Labilibaculum sp.]MBI9058622.1 hypothetical protein [Labilibaculum sp.]
MNTIEKLGLKKKVRLEFPNGIEGLNLKLTELKMNKKFDKFNYKQRQISKLLKGFEKNESTIRFLKTPDIFSAFSGRGKIQIINSDISRNNIEIEFKAEYNEMWFVMGLFIFCTLIFFPIILYGHYETYWIFILIGFFAIVSFLKIFQFKNDIKKLEEEFNNLLRLILT